MKRKRITTGRKKFTSGRAVKIARKDAALSRINEHAAGIDIGAQSHFVAVSPASSATPVREFGVFTRDLYAIADWLKECGVRSVAMESTGVYWVPLYEVLEERGFEVKLVDAR
ncbi:MAG TPA: transposase, partial [Blastocatellia bacterium]|nr:transposase [Blastocatellia bacterium]